jgi:rhodanese-related sulfurtransferase
MPEADYPLEISVTEAKRLRDTSPDGTMILDVREPHELEISQIAGAEHIPMRQIPAAMPQLPRDKHILVLCRVGGRSLQVTHYLRAQGFAAVSNIVGGINEWAREIEPGMAEY